MRDLPEVTASKHAIDRVRERLGIKKRGALREITRAYFNGAPASDLHVPASELAALRRGHGLFLFAGTHCVTVLCLDAINKGHDHFHQIQHRSHAFGNDYRRKKRISKFHSVRRKPPPWRRQQR